MLCNSDIYRKVAYSLYIYIYPLHRFLSLFFFIFSFYFTLLTHKLALGLYLYMERKHELANRDALCEIIYRIPSAALVQHGFSQSYKYIHATHTESIYYRLYWDALYIRLHGEYMHIYLRGSAALYDKMQRIDYKATTCTAHTYTLYYIHK